MYASLTKMTFEAGKKGMEIFGKEGRTTTKVMSWCLCEQAGGCLDCRDEVQEPHGTSGGTLVFRLSEI